MKGGGEIKMGAGIIKLISNKLLPPVKNKFHKVFHEVSVGFSNSPNIANQATK